MEDTGHPTRRRATSAPLGRRVEYRPLSDRYPRPARHEIPTGFEVKLTADTIQASRKEMVEEAVKVLRELDDTSHHYHVFIGQMRRLNALLETQRFSAKGIQKLNSVRPKTVIFRSAM
jgi:hypothetical protein